MRVRCRGDVDLAASRESKQRALSAAEAELAGAVESILVRTDGGVKIMADSVAEHAYRCVLRYCPIVERYCSDGGADTLEPCDTQGVRPELSSSPALGHFGLLWLALATYHAGGEPERVLARYVAPGPPVPLRGGRTLSSAGVGRVSVVGSLE